MENRSHALWAGFFTIALLCATILAGLWLNRDKTQRVSYQIVTKRPISGLNPQASVRYKGLSVGRVDKIEFDPKDSSQIDIDISVDPETPITKSTFATLGYQGVTGIAFIQLDDDGRNPVRLNSHAGEKPRIPLKPSFLETLEENGTVILDKINVISDELTHFFAPDNQKTMLGAFSDTSRATSRWADVADELKPTLKQLPGLAHQANQTLSELQKTAQHTTRLVNQLHDPEGPLMLTLSEFGHLSEQIRADTLPRINELSNETNRSMRTFNETMEQLKEHPQELIFGKSTSTPGPGEAGFVEPKK